MQFLMLAIDELVECGLIVTNDPSTILERVTMTEGGDVIHRSTH